MPIVRDSKGNDTPDWYAVSAERGARYLYSELGLSNDEANAVADANLAAEQKALRDLEKKAPKPGTNPLKYQSEKKAYEEAVARQKGRVQYWEDVKAEAERIAKVEEAEKADLSENGTPFVISSNGSTTFGEITEDSGLQAAPIKLSEGYHDESTGKGNGRAHIEYNHGKQIRKAGFATIEDFVTYVAQNYDHDNIKVGKRREDGTPTYLIQVSTDHDNTLYIELSKDSSYWNVNSGGIFRKGYTNKKETVAKTEPQQPNNAVLSGSSLSEGEQSGKSTSEPNGKPTVSTDKVTNSVSEKQVNDGKKTEARERYESRVQEVMAEQQRVYEEEKKKVDELATDFDSKMLEWHRKALKLPKGATREQIVTAFKTLTPSEQQALTEKWRRTKVYKEEKPKLDEAWHELEAYRPDTEDDVRLEISNEEFPENDFYGEWKESQGKVQKDARGGESTDGVSEEQRVLGEAVVGAVRDTGVDVVDDVETVERVYRESTEPIERRIYVDEVSKRFDEQLAAFASGKMPSNEKFSLGMPSAILLSAGIPAKEIVMNQRVLRTHLEKHGIKVEDLQGLVDAIQKPMMVYEWGMNSPAHVIITDLGLADGRKITVALRMDNDGNVYEVNEVASVHGKSVERLIEDMLKAKHGGLKDALRYVDKEKALAWLTQPSPKEGSSSKQGFDVAKVIENFENPKITLPIIEQMTAWHGSPHDFDVFDFSHMGSGEGAQAHGWGGYVAFDREKGKGYAKALVDSNPQVRELKRIARAIAVCKKNIKGFPKEIREQEGYIKDLEQAKGEFEAEARRLSERYGDDSIEYRNHKFKEDEHIDAKIFHAKAYLRVMKAQQKRDKGHLEIMEKEYAELIGQAPKRNLYEVEIPDDNGSNYLREDSELTPEQEKAFRKKFIEAFVGDEDALEEYAHNEYGMGVDEQIRAEFEGNARRRASKIWRERVKGGKVGNVLKAYNSELPYTSDMRFERVASELGYVGIRYKGFIDGECAVIFNEKDLKIKNKTQFLKTPRGEVYGFVKDGKMYLDPRLMNPETPIHEYTHLWDKALQKANPELWSRGKELMRQLSLWNEIANDKAYKDIAGDEDLLASEVHSRLTGKDGAKYLDDMVKAAKAKGAMAQAEAVTLKEKVKSWLREAWSWVRDAFSGKWSKDDLDKLTLEEFVAMPLKDLARGVNPNEKLAEATNRINNERNLVAVHNISEGNLRNALSLGGFAMPSIAITKGNIGHTNFGDISLVFGKKTINPTDRRNKVYSHDAWTPTFPTIYYKISGDVLSRVRNKVRTLLGIDLSNKLDVSGHLEESHLERGVQLWGSEGEALAQNDAMRLAYIKDKGIDFDVPYKPKDYGAISERVIEFANREGYSLNEMSTYKFYEEHPEVVEQFKQFMIEEDLKVFDVNLAEGTLDQETYDKHKRLIENGNKEMSFSRYNNKLYQAMEMQRDLDNGGLRNELDMGEMRKRLDATVSYKDADYLQWAAELGKGLVEKRGIRNGKDMYTPSGNRRKWEQLHDELTLDNVVKVMLRGNARGGQGFFGSNPIGASAKEYGSIDEIRTESRKRMKMIDTDDFVANAEGYKQRFSDIIGGILERGGKTDFGATLDAMDVFVEAIGKYHTAEGLYKYLKPWYKGMTMEDAKALEGLIKEVQESATKMFEAKPRRAVGFSEVKMAVVPEGTEVELINALQGHDIEVRTYPKGDDEARIRIVDEGSKEMDIQFHVKRGDKMLDKPTPPVREDGEGNAGELRFKLGDPAETFDARQDAAVKNRGTVLPGLNEAQVNVVEVPKHEYKGAKVLSQAVDAAIERYNQKNEYGEWNPIPQHYHKNGQEFEYNITPRSLVYSANHANESENIGLHIAVMDRLDSVINESIEVMEHADVHKVGEKRIEENGYNADALMHRFVGAVNIDGKIYRVVTTLKESKQANNRLHTYDVTEIEVLDAETPSTSNGIVAEKNSQLRVANLLNTANIHNKSGKKILDVESTSNCKIKQ